MNTPRFFIFVAAAVSLIFSGCESDGIANRINEKSAAFSALSPHDKEYIEDGIIFRGFTKDMAYMAVGNPTAIETKEKDGVSVEMWTYRKFYPSGKLEAILTAYSREKNPDLGYSNDRGISSASAGANTPIRTNTSDNNLGLGGSSSTTRTDTVVRLSLPDLLVYNLYILFSDEKIIDIQIESYTGTSL